MIIYRQMGRGTDRQTDIRTDGIKMNRWIDRQTDKINFQDTFSTYWGIFSLSGQNIVYPVYKDGKI